MASATPAGTVDRDDNVYKAKLCEQVEKFDEMIDCMKKVANLPGSELTVEERNLLSVAYKNTVGSRRESWKLVLVLLQKEEAKGEAADKTDLSTIRMYKNQIKTEIQQICNDILLLLDDHLLPNSLTVDSKVFFYKMKGDYYRYLSEITVDDERKEIAENSLVAYLAATEIARTELAGTHPVRLGLALNFSVFYFEVLNSPERACRLAKAAFDDAIADLDSLADESYKDSSAIMQQLRDNLTLWTSDVLESGEVDSAEVEPALPSRDEEEEDQETP